MKKTPFVTLEKVQEIAENIPPHFIFMMRRASGKMHRL